MKKALFFVIALATFSFANAQDISYGLKAGLNYSNWSFSNDGPEFDSRLSFHVGGVVEFLILIGTACIRFSKTKVLS